MSFSLLYVTHPSKPEAIRITTELLNQHLIACASFYTTESMYWWEGRLSKTDEIMTLYKAPSENTPKIQATIESMHKYEIPCIIKIAEVTANASYEAWIQEESSQKNISCENIQS